MLFDMKLKKLQQEPSLKKATKTLQKLLKVSDWDLKVKVANAKEVNYVAREEAYACIQYDIGYMQAIIRISEISEDKLFSLIHEMLHLYFINNFIKLDPDKEEKVINDLSTIIRNAYDGIKE